MSTRGKSAMPKTFSVMSGRPLLDIASYARRGLGRRDHLSPAEISHIARTVRRAPEVVVKVLSTNSSSVSAVARHFDYIGRKGELAMETDDGDLPNEKGVGRELVNDWDLDLDEHRRRPELSPALGRTPPKLVHKLMFSMPPRTPPQKVLNAVRNFAREEFWGSHRYALVLHTDEPHPHVHMVVKAVSERGERLHINKATLRAWRQEFARHLRALGVEANATERSVRGQGRAAKRDGIFRASRRGSSTHVQARVEAVARELASGAMKVETGGSKLVQTHREVVQGWRAVGDLLFRSGEIELASEVQRFGTEMSPPQTEKQRLASELLRQLRPRGAKEQDVTPRQR